VKQARKAGHRDAKAPEMYHAHSYKGRYKPIKIKRAMTLAGSMGFRRAEVVAQRTIARAITFGISRSALLRQVGLSRCLDNLTALDDALLTLSDVIILGNRLRPPLVSVERRAQMLTITVSGTWVNTQYHRVPLPLPTKSPLATHLLLWTHFIGGVKDESVTKKDSDYESFVQKFGYHSAWRANQAVNRAITASNALGLRVRTWPPGTEYWDAETGRQRVAREGTTHPQRQKAGQRAPKIPAGTPYLASPRKPSVCKGWVVELVGLKLATHHPVIEPVSAMRRERKFPPQRQAGKSRLIT
jgi:hypothetical protein